MSDSSFKYDELVLWQDLRNGSEEALASLLRLYSKPLISYGRKMVKDDALIEDCIQEVFIQIWQYRATLKVDVGSVQAYLFSSVRRRIITELRKRPNILSTEDREETEVYFDVDFSIEEQIIKDEAELQRVQLINKHLNNLPKRQKEALYLKFYRDLNNQQIAEVMGIKYQTVGNLIHEALLFLRTILPHDTLRLCLIPFFALTVS